MATILPENFPVPGTAAIATYDFQDIAEGTGIIKFFGAEHAEAGTKSYYLTTNMPYSNSVTLSGSVLAAASDWQEVINKDFDVKFNRPKNIKGYAFLTFSMGGNANTGGNQKIQLSGAQIIRYDGTTETVLATSSSDTLTCLGTGNETGTFNVRFDLTGGPYHFKAGEILRLSMIMFAQTPASNALDYEGFGIDPQNRDDPYATQTIANSYTTKLELYVPTLI